MSIILQPKGVCTKSDRGKGYYGDNVRKEITYIKDGKQENVAGKMGSLNKMQIISPQSWFCHLRKWKSEKVSMRDDKSPKEL